MKLLKTASDFWLRPNRNLFACAGLAALCLAARLALGDDRPVLSEGQFQERIRAVQGRPNDAERLRHARSVVASGWFSSQQVKAMARTITDEDARIEFALAAYPRTIDPENFYDVYDAFTTFSKVFRLHDRLLRLKGPPGGPIVNVVTPLSDEEFKQILRAFTDAPFDDRKQSLARQIITDKSRFLSRQIRDILKTFAFDDGRLVVAKLAYGRTLDPENFFVVNEAFTFESTKQNLSRYIESRQAPPSAER